MFAEYICFHSFQIIIWTAQPIELFIVIVTHERKHRCYDFI